MHCKCTYNENRGVGTVVFHTFWNESFSMESQLFSGRPPFFSRMSGHEMQNTDKSFFFQAKTFKKFPFPGESMKDPGIECGFETLSTGVSVFSARAPDFSGFISLDECEGWISNFWKWVPSCEGWNLNEANEVNDWVVVSNIFLCSSLLGEMIQFD